MTFCMWRQTFGPRCWPFTRRWPTCRCWENGLIADGRGSFDAAARRTTDTWCRSVSPCRRPPASDGSLFSIPPEGVLQRSRPPLLHASASAADPNWRSTIDALVAVGARSGVEPAAFGSLLWQHLTGLAYLTPHSDLDVLWPIPANFDVHSLVCNIAQVQRDAPLRIDGEIIFPDGSGVNWRELWNAHQAAGRATVLAKTMESVRLLDVASLTCVAGHA